MAFEIRVRRCQSPLTAEGYRQDAARLFRRLGEVLGREPALSDLTAERLQALLDDESLKPRTRKRYGSSLRAFFRFVAKLKLCVDVGALLETPKLGKQRRQPRVLTVEDAVRLAEAPLTLTPPEHRTVYTYRDCALLHMLFGTGARNSESLGVDVSGLAFRPAGYVAFHVIGKGDKERMLVIERGRTVEALRDYLKRRDEIPGASETDALFINWWGQRLTRSGVLRIVRRWADRCGLDVWPHLLRHTYATHMVDAANENLRGVQELLGHDDTSQTAAYSHLNERRLLKTARLHPLAERDPTPEELVSAVSTAGKIAGRLVVHHLRPLARAVVSRLRERLGFGVDPAPAPG
jgi:site-specific recombinase XerD